MSDDAINKALAAVKETVPGRTDDVKEWPYLISDTLRRVVVLLDLMVKERNDAR